MYIFNFIVSEDTLDRTPDPKMIVDQLNASESKSNFMLYQSVILIYYVVFRPLDQAILCVCICERGRGREREWVSECQNALWKWVLSVSLCLCLLSIIFLSIPALF